MHPVKILGIVYYFHDSEAEPVVDRVMLAPNLHDRGIAALRTVGHYP